MCVCLCVKNSGRDDAINDMRFLFEKKAEETYRWGFDSMCNERVMRLLIKLAFFSELKKELSELDRSVQETARTWRRRHVLLLHVIFIKHLLYISPQ